MRPELPLLPKLLYTAFLTLLVPVYLVAYGPLNSSTSATSRCC